MSHCFFLTSLLQSFLYETAIDFYYFLGVLVEEASRVKGCRKEAIWLFQFSAFVRKRYEILIFITFFSTSTSCLIFRQNWDGLHLPRKNRRNYMFNFFFWFFNFYSKNPNNTAVSGFFLFSVLIAVECDRHLGFSAMLPESKEITIQKYVKLIVLEILAMIKLSIIFFR